MNKMYEIFFVLLLLLTVSVSAIKVDDLFIGRMKAEITGGTVLISGNLYDVDSGSNGIIYMFCVHNDTTIFLGSEMYVLSNSANGKTYTFNTYIRNTDCSIGDVVQIKAGDYVKQVNITHHKHQVLDVLINQNNVIISSPNCNHKKYKHPTLHITNE